LRAFFSFGASGSREWPGRVAGSEDALEWDLGPLGDLTDDCGGAFELAEDDLVLAQQDRAEVANVRYEAGCDSRIERAHVLLSDVRPEALGDEAADSRSTTPEAIRPALAWNR